MTTTIQLDDATKEDLFRIKLKLEEHKGKPVTYNELIQYLIEGHSSNIFRKKHLAEFRKLKGTISQAEVDMYYEEKRKDLDREEEQAPLSK